MKTLVASTLIILIIVGLSILLKRITDRGGNLMEIVLSLFLLFGVLGSGVAWVYLVLMSSDE